MPEQRSSGRPTDVLFDARHIRQSGIGTYIRMQLPALQSVTARHGLRLSVLADPETVPALAAGTDVVHASPINAGMYTPAEQLVWRRAFAATKPRAVWVPHYPFPLARLLPGNRGVQLYATVHDTIHLLPREVSDQSAAKRAYARAMLAADARYCRRIFTPSEATKTTLTGIVHSARVLVTPIPVGEVWFEPVDRTLSPVSGPFLLYVGNSKRHKNLPLVIEAFAAIADSVPHRLVIAGGGASLRTLDDRVRLLAEAGGDRVVVTGQVDFAVLRALVASAQLLIMPSLYEGAGLPPLEAMASGTAVLSSTIPALRETCGDGADYFDPHDRDALIALLRRYCADDDARAQLAARGHAHVRQRQQQICATAAADAICADLATT
ncbi:glycosyltransferase family 1 protein [Mycobacterium sp. SMC-4]|uniref:glycosyltransferase family 4 protein n=1 Tax=Mycobacterium sp. SMC-4 TaxID=2857059 RepID=UPI0021B25CCF|nr:glycosyltransferase family 1 protein [Mycobacterium sp. SMC-4]UXA19297.1 glycosyltransferase family 4 protein [Mycobacterium sp. SMC-4]